MNYKKILLFGHSEQQTYLKNQNDEFFRNDYDCKNSTQPLTVKRFGYGTMRLTGKHIYGEPANRPEALQILKQIQRNSSTNQFSVVAASFTVDIADSRDFSIEAF